MLSPALQSHRRPSRHTVGIPAQIVRERDFRLIADRIDNLSVTGLLVSPADWVLTGEKLIVSFQSPRWGIWIDAETTVSRVIHGRRVGEFTRALGLEFDYLNDWSRYVLEQNLRWVPVTPPGVGRRPRGAVCTARIMARLSGRAARPLN
jgi:hypothetical protein